MQKTMSFRPLVYRLVDGPFLKDLYDSERDWIGSKNQKLYNLSARYKEGIEYEHGIRSAEILVSDKSILINGWPFQKYLSK